MPVKLKVSQESASEKEQEYLFHEDVITLGRHESNLLILPDPYKRLVSRRHARLERKGTAYYLFDLESQNRTMLNNMPLHSGEPQQVHNGDEIRIGDYHIYFFALVLNNETGESGEVALHPFINETNELKRILLRLAEKYARAEAATRAEILLEALREPLRRLAESDMAEVFARAFARSTPAPKAEVSAASQTLEERLHEAEMMIKHLSGKLEEKEAANALLREEIRVLKGNVKGGARSDTATQPLETITMSMREKQVLELLLDAYVKSARGYYQYLGERAPTTIMQGGDSFKIRHSTPEELHKLFFDPAVPEKKIIERINALKQVLREVIAHPVALLDGHRACQMEMPRRMLQELAYEQIMEELLQRAGKMRPLWRVLAVIVPQFFVKAYRAKHQQLLSEGNGALVIKYFENAFNKHYNLRMDTVRAADLI